MYTGAREMGERHTGHFGGDVVVIHVRMQCVWKTCEQDSVRARPLWTMGSMHIGHRVPVSISWWWVTVTAAIMRINTSESKLNSAHGNVVFGFASVAATIRPTTRRWQCVI